MRLSKHFMRREFACRCGCGFDTVDAMLLTVLERIRGHFGHPVRINCGCRCPAHNRAVGGAPNSQHLVGKAADVVVDGISPDQVADYVDARWPDLGGLGRYRTFTHVDVRGHRARWDNR